MGLEITTRAVGLRGRRLIEKPLTDRLFRHHWGLAPSVVDLDVIQVVNGKSVNVISWYDNEWGLACQMVREGMPVRR